jgi:hypothetical protein
MPMDAMRLRDSDLAAVATGDEFRAAVLLWCACWHQLPAASLPNDDRMLAKLAGYGRDVDAWMIVKKEALRKFVVCDDGRLYHPVIAEKANDAWEKKKAFKARTEAARAARLQKLSQSDDKKPTDDVTISVTENIGQSVTGSKGEGEGQGTGEKRKIDAPEGSGGEKQKRKSRISPEAQPGPADLEHAATAGVSPRIEWPKFRDHHIAKGSLMADWSAAWRTWCANAKQFGRAAPNSMPALSLAPPPTEITPDRWREALRDYCARSGSGWHQGVFGPDPEMSNCRCPVGILREFSDPGGEFVLPVRARKRLEGIAA